MTAAATLPRVDQPRRGRTGLVVDDEPTIAEVFARYLERAGYETATIGDGLEALRLAAERRPDLIVLDVIAALRLLVEAIEDDVVDEATRRRYLATMRTHIDTLSAMIDDLFELSRIEAGQIEWSMRQVELSLLVDETVAAMRPQRGAPPPGVRLCHEEKWATMMS
jgi:CheY-like chemotaxis protein